MASALTPMTPELRALIEKTHRAEAAKGNSTSKRAIAKILKSQGQPVSESRVYQVQKKMSDYNPQKSYAPKKPPRTPQAQISANAYRVALKYLADRGYSTEGLTNSQIIDKANDKKGYERKRDLIKVRSSLSGYAKSKTSPEKVERAGKLLARLNADNSLATNAKFLQEVEAVKNIGARPKEENSERKSAQRRRTIKKQTPMWALRPAYQVELAATGDDVSRGESQKNVNIKKIFPDKFESDHIRRLQDRGLNAPFNIQSLTKEQHNIKRGLENRGLLDRARTLFQHNQYGVHPNVRPLLAENLLEYDPNKGKPFQYLMPDNKSNRARVGSAPMRMNITGSLPVGSNLIGVKRRKTIGEILADLLM